MPLTLHLKNLYEIKGGCIFSVNLHCFGIQDLPFWFGTCFGVILVVLNLLLLLKLLQIAEDYSHCEFLIRLPGFCPSMLVHTQPQDEPPCVSFLISIPGAGTFFCCSQNINLVSSCFSACFQGCYWCTSCCEEVAQNPQGGMASEHCWNPSLYHSDVDPILYHSALLYIIQMLIQFCIFLT